MIFIQSNEATIKNYIDANMRKMSLQSFRDQRGYSWHELNIVAFFLVKEIPDFISLLREEIPIPLTENDILWGEMMDKQNQREIEDFENEFGDDLGGVQG